MAATALALELLEPGSHVLAMRLGTCPKAYRLSVHHAVSHVCVCDYFCGYGTNT